jgi:hypothetical protein
VAPAYIVVSRKCHAAPSSSLSELFAVVRKVGRVAEMCALVLGLVSRQCMFRERTSTSLRAVNAISDLIRLGDGITDEKVGKSGGLLGKGKKGLKDSGLGGAY